MIPIRKCIGDAATRIRPRYRPHPGSHPGDRRIGPPLSANRAAWTHPSDYSATQTLAENARQAGIETIRYESVRDPGGFCLALLTPEAFKSAPDPFRNNRQTWNLNRPGF
ncbi:RES family NAD+ phosphorylase [Methylococcus capsulatus]|uniref:RES family NAD+ phosphorylase n=1 Tax=Methylococcus capsulatus TaxID=414 RepID=UPI0020176279|nr:RES family NAD+ phosphorylase [Methylococcus capsulatus]UQN13528.1 RES family NAD+ phosphorylase [Methylococcus capsulatus]